MSTPDTALRARAEEAQRILDGPVFAEAMREARESLIKDWIEGDTVAKREVAHGSIRALGEVQRQLRRIVNRGTVAGAE